MASTARISNLKWIADSFFVDLGTNLEAREICEFIINHKLILILRDIKKIVFLYFNEIWAFFNFLAFLNWFLLIDLFLSLGFPSNTKRPFLYYKRPFFYYDSSYLGNVIQILSVYIQSFVYSLMSGFWHAEPLYLVWSWPLDYERIDR